MIDHIILTVSNIERSLAFYEAALAPLDIKFFMPYKTYAVGNTRSAISCVICFLARSSISSFTSGGNG
jgi:hypothetical protein